jgi:hypothetical protein
MTQHNTLNRVFKNVMLNAVMLSVILPNVAAPVIGVGLPREC